MANLTLSFYFIISALLRPLHTGGFAPGVCSGVILYVSVHRREHFQVCSICPGILHPNI